MSRLIKEFGFIAILGLIFTVVLTWPFLLNLNHYYRDAGDFPLNGWILWYNQFALRTGRIFHYTGYFNSTQFFPWPFSLAYSDHLFIPSLLFFSPIYWLTRNLILSVNIFSLLTFILSFISSYWCINYLTKHRLASLIGAFIFAFNPSTFVQFPGDWVILNHDTVGWAFAGHLMTLCKFFLPPLFLFAYLFLKNPNLKNALLFYLFFTLNALSAGYYEVFSIVLLPVFSILFIIATFLREKFIFVRTE